MFVWQLLEREEAQAQRLAQLEDTLSALQQELDTCVQDKLLQDRKLRKALSECGTWKEEADTLRQTNEVLIQQRAGMSVYVA